MAVSEVLGSFYTVLDRKAVVSIFYFQNFQRKIDFFFVTTYKSEKNQEK